MVFHQEVDQARVALQNGEKLQTRHPTHGRRAPAAAVAAFAVTEAFGATPLRRRQRNPFSTASDSVPENKIFEKTSERREQCGSL